MTRPTKTTKNRYIPLLISLALIFVFACSIQPDTGGGSIIMIIVSDTPTASPTAAGVNMPDHINTSGGKVTPVPTQTERP